MELLLLLLIIPAIILLWRCVFTGSFKKSSHLPKDLDISPYDFPLEDEKDKKDDKNEGNL